MDNIKTGNLIKEQRKEKGMTQKDLAKILNITDSAVSKWERGICAPDISLIESLAAALDITVTEIIMGQKKYDSHSRNIETTVKNILDYSENQIEQKTTEVKNKLPVIYYGVAIVMLFIVKSCMGFIMDRLSQYAGYYIFTGRIMGEQTKLMFFWIIISCPVWCRMLMVKWAVSEVEGGKKQSFITNMLIHLISIVIIISLSFKTVSEGLHIMNRFNHLVLKGDERYEMTAADKIPFTYNFDTCKYFNTIVYIYDEENFDAKTDKYLDEIISRQPLKINKLEKKNAHSAMLQYHIEELPAVMIIRDGYAEVLMGYDEIFLLESKIHKLKQNNIYFY